MVVAVAGGEETDPKLCQVRREMIDVVEASSVAAGMADMEAFIASNAQIN